MILKQYITALTLATSLFASYDLTQLYLSKGIKSVENELIKDFENKLFWDEYLKNKDVKNGYYENIKYTLISNPHTKNMDVYKNDKFSTTKIFTSNILTGKINGAKNAEGDLKTPIGVYELINKIIPSDQFYGPIALITNYPNKYDQINKRTGDGIWIHGLPFTGNRDPYTKGCIAIENDNLKELDKKIDFKDSILIIGDIDSRKINKESIANVLSQFYNWKSSWQNGDFNKYISFYSKKFKKLDGSNIDNFSTYKKNLFDRNEEKIIEIKDLNVIPYPNMENKIMFKIQFFQTYKTKTYQFAGEKELYIELINNKIEILFEG